MLYEWQGASVALQSLSVFAANVHDRLCVPCKTIAVYDRGGARCAGYGSSSLYTVVGFGVATARFPTTYFRKKFSFTKLTNTE